MVLGKNNNIPADFSDEQISDFVLASFNNAGKGKEGTEAGEFFKKLEERYGKVATVMFLQQYEKGVGDYTAERHEWLDGEDDGGIL